MSRLTDDSGVSLVETVVALLVAALMFSGLALALGQSLKASLVARQSQQAVDAANDGIEKVRTLDYGAIGMDLTGADFAGDSRITGPASGVYSFDPDGAGPLAAEPIKTVTGAGVAQHVTTTTRNGTVFTRRTYVTTPTDALVNPLATVRVTVVVEWTSRGLTRSKTTSTIVTDTRRGLPLPKITWTGSVAKSVSRGGRLDLGAKLVNKGARDRWSLTTTVKNAGGTSLPWTFIWYQDDNADGVWDATETTRMDPDGNNVYDTGVVGTDAVVNVVAVTNISGAEALQADTVSLMATSTAQPTAPQSPPVTDTVTVNAPTCAVAGCQFKNLYLHNWADTANNPTADTLAPASNVVSAMNATASSTATLFNYDTDRDSFPGRSIDQGGGGAGDLSPSKTAFFRYQVATSTTFAGTAYLTLYGVPTSFDPLAGEQVNVFLRYGSASAWTNVGSWSGVSTAWGTNVYSGFVIPLTGLSFVVPSSKQIEVEVQVAQSSSAGMHLGYDTTTFPANLSIPYTVGAP